MRFFIPLFFIIALVIISFNLLKTTDKTSNQATKPQNDSSKQVVVLIIDSIMDEPLQSVLEEKKAPALEFLINNGNYYPHIVSSYPTMSVAIDSTLLTGTYPDQHKIPALVWFDSKNNRLISYGSAKQEIMKLGPKQVFHNSLFQLNNDHMNKNVQTIHEVVNGPTASINTLVYRGKNNKPLNTPKILDVIGFLDENDSVKGPSFFSYGLLSTIHPDNKHTNFWEAFGFNDKFATEEMKYLIEHDRLPAFSLVYFSDNDKVVHKKGVNATKGIEDADKQLQEILNSYSSWDEAIKDTVWIVMGDSGQTDIGKVKNQALVDLRELLNPYQIHKISKPVQKQDQLVLGLNERMSFIYILDENIKNEDIITLLSTDNRIDHIAWREGEWIKVTSTDHIGTLAFKPSGDFTDQYGQAWSIEGNIEILNLQINQENEITYNDYPDGLARLSSAFYSHEGDYLIVDAKPGFEFVGEGSPTHVGGAGHGSLHKQDTFFPMIVTGTEEKPKHERIVDFKEWILKILDPKAKVEVMEDIQGED
ncbi:alkaline phosphatase family protein [Bacillus sp. B15-48]|uniref:alkaline phosphatase family protein n=1 Tax=Bacillus sp. B15-48 TaxID=1548601 RepID=UPI00193F0B7A|nr:alkaline phosphatase family protein [Bacillus sp. B15-48]MBM4763461.1 alkaline phosphatase family protein [Bacillus sp. B15-48]